MHKMNTQQNLDESMKLVINEININKKDSERGGKQNHVAKTIYFDQSGLKQNSSLSTRRTSVNSFIESNLDKCVEEYKAKRFGSKQHYHKSTDDDELESGSFNSDHGFRQAKFALYESLLGHHQHHHNSFNHGYSSNHHHLQHHHYHHNLPVNKYATSIQHVDHQINPGEKISIECYITYIYN